MPGCGKSTVGVLLAKALGLAFMDTDVVFQAQEGRKLQAMIEEIGIDELASHLMGAIDRRLARGEDEATQHALEEK